MLKICKVGATEKLLERSFLVFCRTLTNNNKTMVLKSLKNFHSDHHKQEIILFSVGKSSPELHVTLQVIFLQVIFLNGHIVLWYDIWQLLLLVLLSPRAALNSLFYSSTEICSLCFCLSSIFFLISSIIYNDLLVAVILIFVLNSFPYNLYSKLLVLPQ